MAGITFVRILLGLVVAGSLAACVETSGSLDGSSGVVDGGGGKLRPGDEVEAPDVFQANEAALWDGRPSLGGIWVASPEAVDPERVVMFNPATGKTVKGALFRRERDNPGPRLQLSSDAAEALGVIAGMPTEIQVTALRKVEAAEVAAPVAEAGKDAAAVAAAALDAVDADAVSADAAPEAGSEDDPAATQAEAETPKTRKEKRAEAKAALEAEKAAAAAAAAATGNAEPAATPDAVAVTEIEAAPLDPAKPEESTTAEVAEPAGATEEAVPEGAVPDAAGGAGRTIQIGSFSKEDNAKRAIEALSKIGIVAQSRKVEKDGKVFWSVVATGDASLLQKIKDAGFADAYFLK